MDTHNRREHEPEDRVEHSVAAEVYEYAAAELATPEDAYALFGRIRSNAQARHRSFVLRAVKLWRAG